MNITNRVLISRRNDVDRMCMNAVISYTAQDHFIGSPRRSVTRVSVGRLADTKVNGKTRQIYDDPYSHIFTTKVSDKPNCSDSQYSIRDDITLNKSEKLRNKLT